MNISMLSKLFHEGVLRSAKVVQAPLLPTGHWMLIINKASGEQVVMTKARSQEEKIFKSINAALSDAETIGFNEVSVSLH